MNKQVRPVHEAYKANRDLTVMTMPLLLMAFFFYGPRIVLLAVAGVVAAKFADWFASALRGRRYDKTEISSTPIALIIVMMMPANIPLKIVVASVLIAVLIGKEAFGGYGSYPFNPAAVGFCVAAVSWPADVLRYPPPTKWVLGTYGSWEQLLSVWNFENVTAVEGPSYILRNGALPNIDVWSLLFGDYAGPLGATSALVIISCAVYLYVKKRIPLSTPLSFLAVTSIITFIFPRYTAISFQTFPWDIMMRLNVVKFELLSGAIVFVAVFMVSEPVTMPKNTVSRIIYGALLGFATMMFRYYGTFELGSCFAFLIVNSISGYFDRAIAGGLAKRKGVA